MMTSSIIAEIARAVAGRAGLAAAGGRHMPSDFVVDQWASAVESSSYPDFLLRHDLETSFIAR